MLVPFQLSPKWLSIAAKVIETYRQNRGFRRANLNEALGKIERKVKDPIVLRGLARLLEERTTFILHSLVNSEEVRKRLFEKAAHFPVVKWQSEKAFNILKETAIEFDVTSKDIEDAIFADLPSNELLIEFHPTSPQALIDRYNLAQIQGLLYSSVALVCEVEGNLRKVFTHLRMLRLMYQMERLAPGRYRIHLDGPVSLLRGTKRYGVRLANLLPAILLAKDYRIAATIEMKGEKTQFYVSPLLKLKSHYTPNPIFDSHVEERFFNRFRDFFKDWEIEREGEVFDLGGEVMIPDFTFRHSGGRVAFLEIVGFWTEEYLEKKMAKLKKITDKNFLVAVSSRWNKKFEGVFENLIWFKGSLNPKEVYERLSKIS